MSITPDSDVTVSDEELVARVRAGDRDAFGTLWRRHSSSALAVARQYQGITDPEDILQEAAKAVFSSILRGGGPFGAFRPYLNQSVRNTAVSISRRRREAPVGGLEEIAEHGPHLTYDENENTVERMITVRAFKALPVRWQEVLWYTTVEGMPAREAAQRLNLSPNATAALAKRAREGLRRSWLEAHLNDERLPSQCRTVVRQLPAFERRALNPKSETAVKEHLEECLRCGIVASELDHIAERLPMILTPLIVGGLIVFAKGLGMATAGVTAAATAGVTASALAASVGLGAASAAAGVAELASVGAVTVATAGAGNVLAVAATAVAHLGHAVVVSSKAWWTGALVVSSLAAGAFVGYPLMAEGPTPAEGAVITQPTAGVPSVPSDPGSHAAFSSPSLPAPTAITSFLEPAVPTGPTWLTGAAGSPNWLTTVGRLPTPAVPVAPAPEPTPQLAPPRDPAPGAQLTPLHKPVAPADLVAESTAVPADEAGPAKSPQSIAPAPATEPLADPDPATEPEPGDMQPSPDVDADSTPGPDPIVEPVPDPEPTVVPEPDPAPNPDPTIEPEPTVVPEPDSAPEPEPVVGQELDPAPEPTVEPDLVAETR